MQDKSLNVELRKRKGKNESNRVRNEGFIPAVIYSHGESESVKVKKKDFYNLFKGKISESIIFDLVYTDGKEDDSMAFVKDYQFNPVTDEILHLDFFKVTKGEKIITNIPINFIGSPKGLKFGGVLEANERFIEVECFPKDLPEKVEVDVVELMVGDSIHVKDLELGDAIKILTNAENVLIGVHAMKEEVEEEELDEVETTEEVVEEESVES